MSEPIGLAMDVVDPLPLFDERKEEPRGIAEIFDELRAVRKYVYALELELEARGDGDAAEIVRRAWSRLHDATDRIEWRHEIEERGPEALPVLEGELGEVEGPRSAAPVDTRDRVGSSFADKGGST